MKFSERWLREWVDPPVDTAGLVEQLTMAGLEVDAVEPVAGEFSGVVVARVEAVEPHPDADKLTVCTVDAGEEPLRIVCGVPNVRRSFSTVHPSQQSRYSPVSYRLWVDVSSEYPLIRNHQHDTRLLCPRNCLPSLR